MSIQTQITRLIQAKSDLIAQIQAKGVTVPADASLDDLAALVAAITGGEDLDEVLGEQDDLIAQILTALEGKAAGGGAADPVIEALTVTENGTYEAPSGTDGYNPVVVSVPVPDGYIVPAGELEITENGTHDVTEYASVNVNVAASGGDTDTEDALITRTLTEYVNSRVTSVGAYAFYSDSNIVSVSFPNAVTIGNEAFRSCSKLVNMNFPEATTIGQHGFRGNKVMTEAVFPKVTSLGGYAFRENTALTKVDFGQSPTISTYTFYGCTALDTLILRGDTVASLSGTNALTSTPIANGTGYVYVPASLVNSYKAASGWSNYAAQFRAIEDYPEITGG